MGTKSIYFTTIPILNQAQQPFWQGRQHVASWAGLGPTRGVVSHFSLKDGLTKKTQFHLANFKFISGTKWERVVRAPQPTYTQTLWYYGLIDVPAQRYELEMG